MGQLSNLNLSPGDTPAKELFKNPLKNALYTNNRFSVLMDNYDDDIVNNDDEFEGDFDLMENEGRVQSAFVALTSDKDAPQTYEDILRLDNPDRDAWLSAVKKEVKSFTDRNVFSVVDDQSVRHRKKPVKMRWLFKNKAQIDNSVKPKARCVATVSYTHLTLPTIA